MIDIFERVMNAKYVHLEGDASFAVQKENSKLYLLFEWSNGLNDWKNNFNFPAKPYRNMENRWYAHRGFLKVWKIIEPHIKDIVMDSEIKEIVIAGYSHGAAIALLCHEYCKFNRSDVSIVGYGFGCPRVIFGFVGKNVKDRFCGFTVIRNCRDIVTHLPPSVFGFRHAGKLFKIGDGENYNFIESHFAENYIEELKKIEKVDKEK